MQSEKRVGGKERETGDRQERIFRERFRLDIDSKGQD